MNNVLILFLFGYLLGSIPFGYLFSKNKGLDIRKVGSGNIGGTNISRAFGLGWGVVVGILDISKAIVPTYLALKYLTVEWQIALVALAPALGHAFPIWLKFKGGKAISTIGGALAVLLGWKGFLVLFIIWFTTLRLTKIVSFSSLTMSSFMPMVIWFFTYSLTYVLLGFVFMALAWWAHRENLARLKAGTEPKFTGKKTI